MIKKALFDKLNGKDINSFVLTNNTGASLKLIDYGARIVEIKVPDKNNKLKDVVLGFDSISGYLNDTSYQGAIVGRFGNRINKGKFTLDNKEYSLYTNDGNNHLHGGKVGYDKKIWDSKYWEVGNEMFVEFSLLSPDGDEGYPGNLQIKVIYSFNDDNAISIHYLATTDKKTVINLTNHTYFNLSGYDSGNIMNHALTLDADNITLTNSELIPTGELLNVSGTEFDFRKEKTIGKEIDNDNIALKYGKGYDHNFVINDYNYQIKKIGTLKSPDSGITMDILTNQPCVQLYCGNCINVDEPNFKNNVKRVVRAGLCLETQHAPDSPNHKKFLSSVLDVGQLYDYTTIFKFDK